MRYRLEYNDNPAINIYYQTDYYRFLTGLGKN